MESLQEARDIFIHSFQSGSTECDVFEIRDSGNGIEHLEKTIHRDQAQTYLTEDLGQPTLKLILFRVLFWVHNTSIQYTELAWIPDIAYKLGIEPHLIALLPSYGRGFKTMYCDGPGGERSLNMYYSTGTIRIIVSYRPSTKCTTCLVFGGWSNVTSGAYTNMVNYLKRNRKLFQNCCFMPLSFLSVAINKHHSLYGSAYWDLNYHMDRANFDENRLNAWEGTRIDFRSAQLHSGLASQLASYLRKYLDTIGEQGTSDTMDNNAGASYEKIRKAFSVLEPEIVPMKLDVEWELQRSDDYLNMVARQLMRKDTRLSIELTEAAKADSSSMKVIAVMTMVFLPGTFFATLFAVPSLSWNNGENVVGENFWVYWAFTAPFTVLIVILWLAITQRRQMRSLLQMGLNLPWLRRGSAASETEESEDVQYCE